MSNNIQSSRIAALMQSYTDSLPQRIAAIEDCWKKAQLDWDVSVLKAFGELCHSLAGSAATFEHDAIGDAAGQIETLIRLHVEQGECIDAGKQQAISGLIDALKEIIARH